MEKEKPRSDAYPKSCGKLRSIGGPINEYGFQIESIYMDEGQIRILFDFNSSPPTKKMGHLMEVMIDYHMHFQITDESRRLESFRDIISLPGTSEKNPLFYEKGERFFENLDPKYTEWVEKESYFPLHKDFKLYVFIFEKSYIEVISASPPVFRKIASKQEFYDGLKERVFFVPDPDSD